jgi:hypothetical protein
MFLLVKKLNFIVSLSISTLYIISSKLFIFISSLLSL